jgi:hypothetical protein
MGAAPAPPVPELGMGPDLMGGGLPAPPPANPTPIRRRAAGGPAY